MSYASEDSLPDHINRFVSHHMQGLQTPPRRPRPATRLLSYTYEIDNIYRNPRSSTCHSALIYQQIPRKLDHGAKSKQTMTTLGKGKQYASSIFFFYTEAQSRPDRRFHVLRYGSCKVYTALRVPHANFHPPVNATANQK
ncbi:hypothetical protein BaRGS_00015238 [Batillaria attramentaria]|uniref:Uncharacterized protein n=1 Tax=Batillaria attramentaria TaxID=370345 RepID=A0ABD0L3A9_9CAEN